MGRARGSKERSKQPMTRPVKSVLQSDAGVSSPSGKVGPADKGTVLLVDDEAIVAAVYARDLRKHGFTVEIVTDSVVAAERCRQQRFDVLVSDISLPNMSGLELLRSVREHDLDLPVILMTGGPDVQDAIKAIEHGAFRYLTKPIPIGELADVVSRAARLHQMARVRREALDLVPDGAHSIGDRAGLEVRFANALRTLWMAYQPIVSWSARSVFAHEALVRNDEPTLRRPDDLLDAAERLGRLHDLGRTIRGSVARMLREAPPEGLIFVNLHTQDLADGDLFSSSAPLSAFAERVVLEITERAAMERIPEPMQRMRRLRAMGYRVAVDDLGAGYAGLSTFAQIEPEVVKVDMSLVRGVDRSPTKQKLLRAIIDLCHDLKIQIIAEGIETIAERNTLICLGGDLCQGYLFARPERIFTPPSFDHTEA